MFAHVSTNDEVTIFPGIELRSELGGKESVHFIGIFPEDCDIENPSETKIQQEKCCNNIQELIEGNQTEQQAIDSFELSQVQFVLAYTYTYLGLFKEYKEAVPFNDYNPPLVNKNIQVLYQTFLI